MNSQNPPVSLLLPSLAVCLFSDASLASILQVVKAFRVTQIHLLVFGVNYQGAILVHVCWPQLEFVHNVLRTTEKVHKARANFRFPARTPHASRRRGKFCRALEFMSV